MKKIKRRLYLMICFFSLQFFLALYSYLFQESFLSIAFSVVAIVFLIFVLEQTKQFNAARLIIENEILHLCYAMVCMESGGHKPMKTKKESEAIVSTFGVLVNDRVYPWNVNKVRLKSVEINRDFIWIGFGYGSKKWKLKLFHGLSYKAEVNQMTEKFRYETGVMVVSHDW